MLERVAEYDPVLKRSWNDEPPGTWPHAHHYHFSEAVVAAHLTMLGYLVLRDFGITPSISARTTHATEILHSVVEQQASDYLLSDEFALATDGRSGLPDLFAYRALEPTDQDHKVVYNDPDWFFAEAKRPGEHVAANQKKFWHAAAEVLGQERIRLYRVIPMGATYNPSTVTY